MTDAEIVKLYRIWSEESYSAGFLHATPESVMQFRQWLKSKPLNERLLLNYEQDLVTEFRKQESDDT